MNRNILLVVVCFVFGFFSSTYAQVDQDVTTIDIYKERGLLIIKDRAAIGRKANYEVKKIDSKNHLLIYRGYRPKILYLNENPIYILPGDQVQLNFHRISEPGRERDTVTATGDHALNYIYGSIMLLNSKERIAAIGISYPQSIDPKYSIASASLYDDLDRYDSLSWKYVDSVLSARNYNKNIIRQAELDLYAMRMFSNLFIEDSLMKRNSIQSKDFAEKLEVHFASKNINPVDTTYSPNIEGAISLYFSHLEEIKFKGVKDDEQLSAIISYIRNYPNRFVMEYLLYFLMENYKPRIKGNDLVQINLDLEKISNPFILDALKNGNKKDDIPLELRNILIR